MIKGNREIYIEETEVKPNKFAISVLEVTLIGIMVCCLLNEIGIFRVDKLQMRIGTVIPMIFVLIPLLLMLFNKNNLKNPAMKYIVICSTSVFIFATTTLLTFHTMIMLIFPMFIAIMYRSKRVGIIALISSISCTVLSPIISFSLGTWDIDLFKELILIGTTSDVEIPKNEIVLSGVNIGKIVLYLVIPRLIMVGSSSILMFHAIRLNEQHVENQIKLHEVSNKDALTGLYNQNFYREVIKEGGFSGLIGIAFFDVNYLKNTNDTMGHEQGDLIIKRSAESILNVCDGEDSNGFRVGGDEFVIIMKNATEEKMKNKMTEWEASLRNVNMENKLFYGNINCSVASGYIVGNAEDIEALVCEADDIMYKKKCEMKEQ